MTALSLSEALTALEKRLSTSSAEEVERVLEEARALRRMHPEAVRVLRLEAHASLRAQRWSEAAEVFERVVSIVPTDGAALAGLAHALHQLGRTAEAAAAARQALDYLPHAEGVRAVLGGACEGNAAYRAALLNLRVGRLSQAVRRLQSLAQANPDRLDMRLMASLALWRVGAYIVAAEQCMALLDTAPDVLAAHVVLGDVWHRAGASSLASWHWSVVARFDPDHSEVRALFGQQTPAALLQGQTSLAYGAEHTPQAALTLNLRLREEETPQLAPSWSKAWLPLVDSDTHEEVNMPQMPAEQVAAWDSLEDQAGFVELQDFQFSRSEATQWQPAPHEHRDMPDEAAATLEQARRALRHAKGQQLDELIATLERMRARTPDNAELLTLLGQAYLRRGDTERALATYQQALAKM